MHVDTSIALSCVLLCAFLAVRTAFRATENRPAALSFSGFLLAAASYVLGETFVRENWYATFPAVVEWMNVTVLCVGPFFYLYCRCVSSPTFRIHWGHTACFALPLLLLPFIVLSQWVPIETRIAAIRQEQMDLETGNRSVATLCILAVFNLYHLGFIGAGWVLLWRGRETLFAEREEGRSHPVRALGFFATAVLAVAIVSAFFDFSPWASQGAMVTSLAILLVIFALLWLSTETNPFSPPVQRPGRPVGSLTGLPALQPETVSAPAAAAPAAMTLSVSTALTAFGAAAGIDTPPLRPASLEPFVERPSTPRIGDAENQIATTAQTETAAPAGQNSAALETPPEVQPNTEVSPEAAPKVDERKARRDGLKPEDIDRLAQKMERLLEKDHVYLDSGLSLQKLASLVGTTRHKLSLVINERFGGTFYQVIASYRVKAAAAELIREASAHRTIADIAMDSGFNSLSAFNAAFRAHFGQTPREYREARGTSGKQSRSEN